MTLKLYDKQGNVEFDSTNVTLGLIKSCPVKTHYPAWIADFILMYGHIINPQKFNFNPDEVKRQKNRLGDGYLDILDVMNAREKIYLWLRYMVDFSAPVRLGVREIGSKDNNRVDVAVLDNGSVYATFLEFVKSNQNKPNNDIYNYDNGRFVLAFNQALDDDYFGFKSPIERTDFIIDFVKNYKYLQFASDFEKLNHFYVDIERDICPIAFLGANGAWHSKMNFEWSASMGGYPLISFDKVSWNNGKWRFHFSSAFFLSATELNRFGVYFFDLYSKKETKVGLNTYDKKGNLSFSTAQPPLKAVYVNLPELKSIDKIVEPTRGWTLNSAKDVAFYGVNGKRTYATLCTYGFFNYDRYRNHILGGYDYTGYGVIHGSIDMVGIKGGVVLFLSASLGSIGRQNLIHTRSRNNITSFKLGAGTYIKDQSDYVLEMFGGYVMIDTTHLPFPYN